MQIRIKTAIAMFLAAGSIATAQSLTTGTPNNGSGGVFMDLTATSQELMITGFDVAYTGTTGTQVDVEVWTRPGSYVGFDGSSAGWTLSEVVSGTRGGTTVLTPLTLNSPIALDVNQVTAVYLHCITTGGGIRYNGTSAAPPQTTWMNNELTLFSDVARTGNVPFAGSRFTPRTFAGTVHYIPADPTPGACCLSDGSCQAVSLASCIGLGGTFQGPGTDCSTANCPQPAACCFADGSCQLLLQAECDNQGGTFNGAATCAAANCPQPGACCVPAGCVLVQEAECQALSGQFRGPGTDCATANCPPATQVLMELPPFGSTFTSATLTRGFWFVAPADFEITGVRVPDESMHGLQNFEIVRLNVEPPAFSATTNDFVSLERVIGEPSGDIYPVAIPVMTGEIIGVLGACGDASTMRNSYGTPAGPFQTSILGLPTTLTRMGMQFNLVTTPMQDLWTEVSGAVGRVEIYYSEGAGACYPNCDGSTVEPILNVDDFTCFVNEFAAAQTLPYNQQVEHYANCDGSTVEPVLNVDDFTCFINEFAIGCE